MLIRPVELEAIRRGDIDLAFRRALREVGVDTLEGVSTWTRRDLAALHGVGPFALDRLHAAMAERGLSYADG